MKPLVISIAASGIFACAPAALLAAENAEQTPLEYAEIAPLASRALLLDAARAGSRMVVVGERGIILLSDDQGASWRQAKVPTRSNLTAVFFLDSELGWAVGHDEVIVRSDDGGENWTRVHFAPEAEQPLLDVWFRDADAGYAFGAYGTILASTDGGRSWREQIFEPQPLIKTPQVKTAKATKDDEFAVETSASDMHLNAITRAADGKLYLAAEAGHLFRSDDGGVTWLELPSPYEGSFFGILPLDPPAVLALGLRGHLFRSDDNGASWRELNSGTIAMLTDGLRPDPQTVVITGLAGTLLISRDGGQTFTLRGQEDRKGLATALAVDGELITVGEGGIKSVPMPAATP